jgi:hypothetical protein
MGPGGTHGIRDLRFLSAFLVRRGGIEPPTRGFSVLRACPEIAEEVEDFAIPCSPNVRSIARAQLRAVAEGREGQAAEIAVRLAAAVLTSSSACAGHGAGEEGSTGRKGERNASDDALCAAIRAALEAGDLARVRALVDVLDRQENAHA